ncbi:MAG TPA: OB-fold domain-containing protein [Acidimicrobiia bacterium]
MTAGAAGAGRYFPGDWPLPDLSAVNRAFFTAGVLTLQRCRTCSQIQHPPHELCHHCQSDTFDYVEASGLGTVDNVTVVHHAGDARLADRVPYNVVIVTPDDHPDVRIVGNVINADNTAIEIGAPVRCTFAEVADPDTGETLTLPQWQLRQRSTSRSAPATSTG